MHDTYVLSVRQRDTKNVFILALIVRHKQKHKCNKNKCNKSPVCVCVCVSACECVFARGNSILHSNEKSAGP